MLRGVEPAPVAGKLIGAQQALPHVGADIELDHSVRVAFPIRLAFDGHTDEEAGPRVVRRCLATIQQEVAHVGQVRYGGWVAAVAVVVHQSHQHAGRTLANVPVVPIAGSLGQDHAVGSNLPVAAEHVIGIGSDGGVGRGPGITLERLSRDAHPQIALAVQALIPRGDDAVRIHHGIVAVIARLSTRGGGLQNARRKQRLERVEDWSYLHIPVESLPDVLVRLLQVRLSRATLRA